MNPGKRRYDVDWLRVLAIALLLIYHVSVVFQPWGKKVGFIQNEESITILEIPMSMINIWRIPLLFIISGMGVCFAMEKRNWMQLLLERTRRILIPLLFGSLAVVPVHRCIFQAYYGQELVYRPRPGHLWFLGNIYIYVLIFTALFSALKNNPENTVTKGLKSILKYPVGLYLFTLPFIIEAWLIRPRSYAHYAFTDHGFWMGLIAFFSGFCFILVGDLFWKAVERIRYPALVIAFSLYLLRLAVFHMDVPHGYTAFESANWLFAVFGFGSSCCNHPGKILRYLSQAAYPVYIVHMIFIYSGSFWILPLGLPGSVKLIILTVMTFVGSLLLYECLIRRINIVRPLFGLKQT